MSYVHRHRHRHRHIYNCNVDDKATILYCTSSLVSNTNTHILPPPPIPLPPQKRGQRSRVNPIDFPSIRPSLGLHSTTQLPFLIPPPSLPPLSLPPLTPKKKEKKNTPPLPHIKN